MELAQDLLDILVCPESRDALIYFPGGESGTDETAAFLFCGSSRLKYRIDGAVPVMLVDDAERLDESAATALLERARELGLAGA